MQVRHVEHGADARLSHRQKEMLSRFSQEAQQALEGQQDILVTEVTSEVWRRDEQVYGIRAELNLQAPRAEDAT